MLVRNGTGGTVEGVSYNFAAGIDGRLTVTGGTIATTMSALSERGAVLQMCRTTGVAAGAIGGILIDDALALLGVADLNGKTYDELECRQASGEFVTSGSFFVVTAGIAAAFENAQTPVGNIRVAEVLSVNGSSQFLSELGIVRWRAYRRPGGGIVIVETQTGGTVIGPGREAAAARLYIQR